MCDFCEKEKPIISSVKQFHDRTESTVCVIKGKNLRVSALTQTAHGITPPASAETEIRFCPMCGRKLV